MKLENANKLRRNISYVLHATSTSDQTSKLKKNKKKQQPSHVTLLDTTEYYLRNDRWQS
jgi:hypothetical protein